MGWFPWPFAYFIRDCWMEAIVPGEAGMMGRARLAGFDLSWDL